MVGVRVSAGEVADGVVLTIESTHEGRPGIRVQTTCGSPCHVREVEVGRQLVGIACGLTSGRTAVAQRSQCLQVGNSCNLYGRLGIVLLRSTDIVRSEVLTDDSVVFGVAHVIPVGSRRGDLGLAGQGDGRAVGTRALVVKVEEHGSSGCSSDGASVECHL